MEISQELIERVQANQSSIQGWRNVFNSPQYQDALRLNELIGGVPFSKQSNCTCVPNFYVTLEYFLSKTQNNTSMKTTRFNLKAGAVVQSFGGIVSQNSTDEEKLALLKISENHLQNFESVPENWKEMAEDSEVEASKKQLELGVPKSTFDEPEEVKMTFDTDEEVDEPEVKPTPVVPTHRRGNKKR